VVSNEMVDIDGWTNCKAKQGKAVITVLGGYLTQIMIVLNTICKEFLHLDRPGAVTKVPKAGSKAKPDDRPKSDLKAEPVKDGEPYERQLINATAVQNFVFTYIGEKLKTENQKLNILVDHRYESFLSNMPAPLQINQMRTMKEPNYTGLRQLLSKHIGNPVL